MKGKLVEDIANSVVRRMDVSRRQLFQRTRGRKATALARQVMIFVIWQMLPSSTLTEIGRLVRRDRTTVRHAIRAVTRRKAEDPEISKVIQQVNSDVRQRIRPAPTV